MRELSRLLAALLLVATANVALAQDHPNQDRPNRGSDRPNGQQQSVPYPNITGQENGPGVLSLLPGDAVTEHSIDLPSGKLAYTATAGTFSLFDTSGQRSAAIFYTAFVAKTDNPAPRPVTFVFNGGPGAASAFLNLGLVGPRIAEFGMNGRDGANVKLIDNPDTWLAFTDLVLIDPVGTGWSRAAKPDGSKAFWNVDGDAESMAKVIALYLAKNSRAASPKFILGESYGGFRAAKVARDLQNDQGVLVSGILMLSPLLEGAFQFGGERFALGAALQLPSLAAAKLERDGKFSTEALGQAEHFALTDYLTTLAGPPLQGDAAKAFYARVSDITGVSADALAETRGFIRDNYVKNLYPRGRIVSHYDATFASDDPYPESPVARGPDPILDGVIRGYGSTFVGYARDELGFKTDMTYNLLAGEISNRWEWGGTGRGQPSIADDLRVLLALSPSFRLLIAHGYSDMVTPYSDSRYVLLHLPNFASQEGEPGNQERAELKLYRGGHMFYLDPASRKAFTADARTVYASP
ncbi:MAG TPA: carboxypeptidase [Xanthobacteraceae bacterium]|jgi:carboxypeptidase C (cathepsin A)|nr:carboxypeptidase [Xanthobacteraceae bacterium]